MKKSFIVEQDKKSDTYGLYYGVALKTSPWSIIRSFTSSADARDWIKREKAKHPGAGDHVIVAY